MSEESTGKSAPTNPVYGPAEDSYLLQSWIKSHANQLARSKVLDMGTGSGILGEESARHAAEVLFVDINPAAITAARDRCSELTNCRFLKSDLFTSLDRDEMFHLILFNPPYLPTENEAPDPALDGGKKGYEVFIRFLKEALPHLLPEGRIITLFSTMTGKDRIEQEVRDMMLDMNYLEEESLWLEKLFLVEIVPSPLRSALVSAGFGQIAPLARGKRGLVYSAKREGQHYAIKIPHPDSQAIARIENEETWLRKLKGRGIGPQIFEVSDAEPALESGSESKSTVSKAFEGVKIPFVIMEYVEGEEILDFIAHASIEESRGVIRKLLEQMVALDEMGVNKEEMHWPIKHVIVRDGKPVLLDFERCRHTERVKNVTQCLQFLSSQHVQDLLNEKGFDWDRDKLVTVARDYAAGKGLQLSALSL